MELKYSIEMKLLMASDYGVPQHRQRLFIIASRTGIHPSWPEKSGNFVTVRDAIGDLQFENCRLEGNISLYLNDPPEHGSYAGQMRRRMEKPLAYNHNPSKAGTPRDGLRRILDWDFPSPTILASKHSRDSCLHPGNFYWW